MDAILILFALMCLLIWLFVVLRVISMRDDDFDGRNDKLIWFLLVFFGSIFGALIFCIWRLLKATSDQRSKETERVLLESMTEVLENSTDGNDKE